MEACSHAVTGQTRRVATVTVTVAARMHPWRANRAVNRAKQGPRTVSVQQMLAERGSPLARAARRKCGAPSSSRQTPRARPAARVSPCRWRSRRFCKPASAALRPPPPDCSPPEAPARSESSGITRLGDQKNAQITSSESQCTDPLSAASSACMRGGKPIASHGRTTSAAG